MIRKLCAGAVTLGLCLIATPVTGASAASTSLPASPGLTFIPPNVGPICVAIGEIILGGTMVSPGLNVCTTGAPRPPIQA
jgi:hypothetical protein